MYDLPARIMTNPPHKRHQCCARPPRKQRKRPADKPVRAHSPPSADTNLQNDQIHVPMPAPPWQTPPFHSEKCSTHNGKPAPIPYTQKTAGICPLFSSNYKIASFQKIVILGSQNDFQFLELRQRRLGDPVFPMAHRPVAHIEHVGKLRLRQPDRLPEIFEIVLQHGIVISIIENPRMTFSFSETNRLVAYALSTLHT